MNRPPSIILFEKVFFASIVISVITLALSWNRMVSTAVAQRPGIAEAAPSVMLVGAAIGIGIPILLWYFIARRASNVAKWIFVVLTAISIFSFVSSIANPMIPGTLMIVVGAVTTALQVFAAWLLFKPDARAWLESRGVEGRSDSHTID